jgi:hypothetical protein
MRTLPYSEKPLRVWTAFDPSLRFPLAREDGYHDTVTDERPFLLRLLLPLRIEKSKYLRFHSLDVRGSVQRAYHRQWQSNPVRLIGLALRHHCKLEDNWSFRYAYVARLEREFYVPFRDTICRFGYALKCVVCILLRRKWIDRDGSRWRSEPDWVLVVAYDTVGPYSSLDTMSACYEWTNLHVAHGWRRWYYEVDTDGNY